MRQHGVGQGWAVLDGSININIIVIIIILVSLPVVQHSVAGASESDMLAPMPIEIRSMV